MGNSKIMDMHIHTSNSDGEYTVEEIVKKVRENNIGTFSITDHDNIDSVSEIKNIELGDLEFYNGVEINSEYKDIGIHILAYDFIKTEQMEEIVNRIKTNRQKRGIELVEMLKEKYNINIPHDKVKEILGHKTIARPHIAEVLYKLGYVNSVDEAFKLYLGNYNSKIKYRVNISEVVDAIKKSNGIVILAHPKEIENRHKIAFESILPELIAEGIDGIEVYNNIHNLDDIERYKKLVSKYNLLVSGGSDYHGPTIKPDVVLGGVSKEKITIKELSLIDELRRRNFR